MKNKKLKILLAVIAFCGVHRLSGILVYKMAISSEIENDAEDSKSKQLFQLPAKYNGKKLAFHHVYEPRQIGFPAEFIKTKAINETKVILIWTPWNGVIKTINYYSLKSGNKCFADYNCPNSKCIATRDRKDLEKADAVLFHLVDTKSSDLPLHRTANQIWILYNMEPPWLLTKEINKELRHLKNTFNWTMTYRNDADVLARYGFIMSTNKTISEQFQRKTKNIVWFVSDCKTDSKREEYANELKKYIDVDVYGTCGDHKCYPSQSYTCYENVLKDYKFYLSFENALCKDYVTEKFFNIFNYDIIPIVFGAADYSTIAPLGTFIDATKYSEPKLLAKILLEIGNNEEMYKNIILKKRTFTSYLDPWTCRLCDALHTNTKSLVLHDIEEWWLTEAQCKTWNKTMLQFVDSSLNV